MADQRTEAWFADRVGRITASRVGAIMGCDPYCTPEQLMRRMVREYHGAESEFTGNIATQYGEQHEDHAIIDFRAESGRDVAKCGFIKRGLIFGASPDGLVGKSTILEVKCPFGLRGDTEPVFKDIFTELPHYLLQVEMQLYCTQRAAAYFYQWSPYGSRLQRVFGTRDSFFNEVLPACEKFHAEYLSIINSKKRSKPYLEPLLKEVNTPETKQIVDEIDQLTDAIELATERKKELLERLKILVNNKSALVNGRRFVKSEVKGSVSYAKVVNDHCQGVDLEPYTGEKSTRWKLT